MATDLGDQAFCVHRGKGAGRLKSERLVLECKLRRDKGRIFLQLRWWVGNVWHQRRITTMNQYREAVHMALDEIMADHRVTLEYVGPEATSVHFDQRSLHIQEKMAALASGQLHDGVDSVAEF